MPTLATTLSALFRRAWPARRHQELLLDLGVHKAWGDGNPQAAIDHPAAWLLAELGLPAWIEPLPGGGSARELDGSDDRRAGA